MANSATSPTNSPTPAASAAAPAAAATSTASTSSASSATGAAQPFHTASLYVGDIHPEVTEALLFEIFNAVGPVASIRVCRDAVTRRSLGYAYVNFHNVADAERALDTMNFTSIKGVPCRIMWSQRDPSLRKSGVGNIFVKNLDTSIDNKALYDTFSLFGNILSCKVAIDHTTGNSKGYGYVHYETAEAATEAIAKINGMLIAGTEVFVGHFQKRQDRPDADDWTNCYVKNIPTKWTDADLLKEFEPFGKVLSAVVMKDNANPDQNRGFGFVNYEDSDAAHKAVDALNGKAYPAGEGVETELYVGKAQKRSERERELRNKFEQLKMERINKYQGVNLYVKNLDDQLTDDELREAFTECGTITSSRVMRDQNGNSRGFGFVCFSTPEEANKAVAEMNGKLISGKPVYVALAQRKEVRRAQLEAQHAQQRAGMVVGRGMPMGQPPMYMETELGELRQRVGKTPLVTQGSSPPGPKESTLAIAQSTSPSDTTGIPPFWRNMSSQQKLRREKSERENARLKLVLEGQIKLAKSMEKVLQKRARQQLSECAGHVGQNGAQGRTQDFLSDKSTFDTLLSSVDAAYHEVEEVFAANGLTDSETPCRDARMREGTNGMYLDISSNNALPFSKETVGRVVWNHFKGTEKHRGNLYEKATKKVGTTKDTVMEDFKMEFMGKATRADFRVKQVLRRYVEADRELVLWVTNVRSMDEGENRPFAGLGFLEKGYVVIKRPKSSALLKGGFTVLQMCTLVVPQKGETCTQDATAVGAFTEFVLNVFVANTMASEERIENVLLDQALRNPPPVILETRQP